MTMSTPDGAATPSTPTDNAPPTPFDPEPGHAPEKSHAVARPRRHEQGAQREKGFFDRVAAIPAADWGARYYLYLYCLEPICNLKISGEKKYMQRFEEPVTSEHQIMVEYGSGKYRLMLVNHKATADEQRGPDQHEFEIFNPKYPPKLPKEVWVNDPRNKRWEAILPKEPPTPLVAAPAVPSVDPLAAFDTFMGIQDRIEARVKPVEAPPPQAPPAPSTDPFDLVKKIMDMRGNDPMITLLLARMEAMDKGAEAARQREYELQKELRQLANTQQTAAAPKSAIEQLKELLSLKDTLKEVLGIDKEAATTHVRSRMSGWMELVSEIGPQLVNAPILNALATRIANGAPQQPPTVIDARPVQNTGGTVPPGTNPPGPDVNEVLSFVQTVVTPALCEYFRTGNDGKTFAAWIDDGYPGRVQQLQQFGAQRIIDLYKNAAPPEVKAILLPGGDDKRFVQFVTEFCAWKDEDGEDEPAPPVVQQTGIIDLDKDEREEKGV